jgi:hypothetical protein
MTKTALVILVGLLLSPLLPALDKGTPGSPTVTPPSGPQDRGPASGVMEADRNADGVADYRVYYDGSGRVSREELDFNDDGKMDTFYYYAAGVLQREEVDSNYDGRIDLWVYLMEGTYVQKYERDTDGDGKPDVVRSFGG